MAESIMSNYKDAILRDLGRLVAIESVAVPHCTIEGYPFGHQSAEALHFMLTLAEEMGLSTANADNYAVHAQLGEGGDEDYAAVLTHVDVVPTGGGWNSDPLMMTERDGYLYGRGVADDKGAAMVALYCLKAMKDNGVVLRRPIRCIFGGGEEIGMDDMGHYFAQHALPTYAFTPDADYPACNCEKGILHLNLSGVSDKASIRLVGGSAVNCVAEKCSADIACTPETAKTIAAMLTEAGLSCSVTKNGDTAHFEVTGVSAHAMCPENGRNAVDALLTAAAKCGIWASDSAEQFFADCICGGLKGEKIGADCSDKTSGELTMNVGLLSQNGGITSLGVDIRYPATLDGGRILQIITRKAGERGISVEVTTHNPPLYIPADHPLIQALGECYTAFTGEEMKPMAMGGGTYARTLGGRGVAFGPVFPNANPSNLHMPNENLSLDELMLHAEICYKAMCRIAQMDGNHAE